MMRPVLALSLLLATIAATSKAQWQLQDAHTTADLRGIDNVGNGVAWASGTDGTILRTEDAGIVWQLCAKPPGGEHLDFRAIQAFDNNAAIVMSSGKGDLSRLYKTTDGCQSWKLVFTNPDKDGFWDAMRFAPKSSSIGGESPPTRARHGIIVGDSIDGKLPIFVTNTSGDTWQRWGNKVNGVLGDCGQRDAIARKDEGLFAASNKSLVIFDLDDFLFVTGGPSGSRLVSTHYVDEGGSACRTRFDYVTLPLGNSTASSGAFAVAAAREGADFPSKLMIVGGDYLKPNESSNSAVLMVQSEFHPRPFEGPFRAERTSQPHGYRSAVAYDFKTDTWITIGPNGTDISTDDGRNWRALHPDPKFNDAPDADQHWNALSLPYAVGPHGHIGTLRPSSLQSPK